MSFQHYLGKAGVPLREYLFRYRLGLADSDLWLLSASCYAEINEGRRKLYRPFARLLLFEDFGAHSCSASSGFGRTTTFRSRVYLLPTPQSLAVRLHRPIA